MIPIQWGSFRTFTQWLQVESAPLTYPMGYSERYHGYLPVVCVTESTLWFLDAAIYLWAGLRVGSFDAYEERLKIEMNRSTSFDHVNVRIPAKSNSTIFKTVIKPPPRPKYQDTYYQSRAHSMGGVDGLKKNLANKIFRYLARCEFWAKIGLRFWILVG